MQELLVTALRVRRPAIRSHWEALLRAEPVTTPLGNPDALIHLIEWTMDEIFVALGNPLARSRVGGTRFAHDERPICPCGRNPLLAYFSAGEQAMREALILVQASAAPLDPLQRDASLYELDLVFQQISRREIEAFCGVCQFRRSTTCDAESSFAAHGSEYS
jgi:hypothetical protein